MRTIINKLIRTKERIYRKNKADFNDRIDLNRIESELTLTVQ